MGQPREAGRRGVRASAPTPSPQGTPRSNKVGRGRRGGRWGHRQLHSVRPEAGAEVGDEKLAVDIRIGAFSSIVDALDKKAAGLPFPGFLPSPKVRPSTLEREPSQWACLEH